MLKEALLVNVHKYTLNSTFSGQRQIFCDIRKTTCKLETNQDFTDYFSTLKLKQWNLEQD